jgi:guanine deaminase
LKKETPGTAVRLIEGDFLHSPNNPFTQLNAVESIVNSCMAVSETGHVMEFGDRRNMLAHHPGAEVIHFGHSLILPGFVDLHTHFPQTFAAASSEKELISWLNHHIFPAESRLATPEQARTAAEFYVRKLLSSGTTLACVFGSQFFKANQELFSAAQDLRLDLVTGMTLMDRFTPEKLLLPFHEICDQNDALYKLSLSMNHITYACTPRFAISCTPELLEYCGAFAKQNQTFIQTHINESEDEVRWVHELYPDSRDYASVYDQFNLLTPKTILAHSIFTRGNELRQFLEAGAKISHCPSSNFFLGSGCFPLQKHLDAGISFGVGTDIGAGTHFSILNELGDAYKAQQINGKTLSAGELLYLGTRAGALALGRDDLGAFQSGNKADFVVVSWKEDAYLTERIHHCESLEDIFFVLMFFSNQSHITKVYKSGKPAFPEPDCTSVWGH